MRIKRESTSTKYILLLRPAKTAKGGITNYFEALNGNFKLPVQYFTRGARTWPNRNGIFLESTRAIMDYLRFIRALNSNTYSLLQTSTSLGLFSIIRDWFFLKYAQKKKIKTIAFIRGWDEDFENLFSKKLSRFFKSAYFKTDAILVLSSKFEDKIKSWGYNGTVYIETTIVDENLIQGFQQNALLRKIDTRSPNEFNILFLARTEIRKGLYETIEAFSILKNQFKDLSLTIAGDGSEIHNAKAHVTKHNLRDIYFTGFILGKEKACTFRQADIYIFPSYTEGMPNSVLEAMAFGLPVITTPVGGVTDFFIDDKHGFLIQNNTGKEIANLCTTLILDKSRYKRIAKENFNFSRARFTTRHVVTRLEKLYNSILTN